MEDDLQLKMTLKYEKQNISATTGRILLKFETYANGIKPEYTRVSTEDDLQWKMTSNMKRRISQQPLVRSFSNLKLKLMGSKL
jgi:hypothetical protein